MKLLITWLLVLAIASLLGVTALADTAALHKMPCCPGSAHSPERCHQFCAGASSDGNVVVPRISHELRATAPAEDTQATLAPTPLYGAMDATRLLPSGKLFKRIHVFLI
jgi:hypothetical protein